MRTFQRCIPIVHLILLFSIVLTSCEKLDLSREIAMATKDIQLISSTEVLVTGEIVDQGEGIQDYGFVFSSSNNLPTILEPGRIELDDEAEPGEFVQLITDLDPKITYWVRAYATPDGTHYTYSEPKTFMIQDIWTQKSAFGGTPRANAVAFTVDGKGYMGMGNNTTDYLYDLWEYDPDLDTWTQKADFPSGTSVTNFHIATTAGAIVGIEGTQETWAYDEDGNTWIQRADFPGVARYLGYSFSLQGRVYFGGGVINEPVRSYPIDLWEYDPNDDVWTRKADFPSTGREHAACFNIGPFGFIGMGFTLDGLDNPTYHVDFWRYDPTDDSGGTDTRGNPLGSWIRRADAPGASRFIGYTLDARGFVFSMDRFLIYEPISNSWSVSPPFDGTPRFTAAGFALNGRAYVGTGAHDVAGDLTVRRDFWEYVPPVY